MIAGWHRLVHYFLAAILEEQAGAEHGILSRFGSSHPKDWCVESSFRTIFKTRKHVVTPKLIHRHTMLLSGPFLESSDC